jgi:general secretion pathway protein C
MKRWPLLATFILFIALCVSAAFWAMQLFKPPVRPVAAVPQAAQAAVPLDATAALFGGRAVEVVVASNFQLTGVVVAPDPKDSIAILVTDTKPPQTVRVNAEVMPGVLVKEVHKTHVLLLERGVVKRVELPDPVKLMGAAMLSPVPLTLDSRIHKLSSPPAGITPVQQSVVGSSNARASAARPADGHAPSAGSMRYSTEALRGAQQQQADALRRSPPGAAPPPVRPPGATAGPPNFIVPPPSPAAIQNPAP